MRTRVDNVPHVVNIFPTSAVRSKQPINRPNYKPLSVESTSYALVFFSLYYNRRHIRLSNIEQRSTIILIPLYYSVAPSLATNSTTAIPSIVVFALRRTKAFTFLTMHPSGRLLSFDIHSKACLAAIRFVPLKNSVRDYLVAGMAMARVD